MVLKPRLKSKLPNSRAFYVLLKPSWYNYTHPPVLCPEAWVTTERKGQGCDCMTQPQTRCALSTNGAPLMIIPGHRDHPANGDLWPPKWTPCLHSTLCKIAKIPIVCREWGQGNEPMGWNPLPALWPWESHVLSLGLGFLICQMVGAIITTKFQGFCKYAIKWCMQTSSNCAWHVCPL